MFDAFEEDMQNVAVGRITLIEGMNAGFRGSFVGWFQNLPEEGEAFEFFGESEDAGKVRRVRTQPVTEIYPVRPGHEDLIAFKTENAIYEVKRFV